MQALVYGSHSSLLELPLTSNEDVLQSYSSARYRRARDLGQDQDELAILSCPSGQWRGASTLHGYRSRQGHGSLGQVYPMSASDSVARQLRRPPGGLAWQTRRPNFERFFGASHH